MQKWAQHIKTFELKYYKYFSFLLSWQIACGNDAYNIHRWWAKFVWDKGLLEIGIHSSVSLWYLSLFAISLSYTQKHSPLHSSTGNCSSIRIKRIWQTSILSHFVCITWIVSDNQLYITSNSIQFLKVSFVNANFNEFIIVIVSSFALRIHIINSIFGLERLLQSTNKRKIRVRHGKKTFNP